MAKYNIGRVIPDIETFSLFDDGNEWILPQVRVIDMMVVIKFTTEVEGFEKLVKGNAKPEDIILTLAPVVNRALDYVADCIVEVNPDFPKEKFLKLDITEFMKFLQILFDSHSFQDTKKKFQALTNLNQES